MSGLLQRLASQATGSGEPKVHAATRGLFTGIANDGAGRSTVELETGPDRTRGQQPPQPSKTTVVIGAPSAAANLIDERTLRSAELAGVPMPATPAPEGTPHRQTRPTDTVQIPTVPTRAANGTTNEEFRPPVPMQLLDHHRLADPAAITPPRQDANFDLHSPSIRDSGPNEVHVHIGRIEVTAVQPAAPPKRAAPTPVRKPISLEEYLAQRQRRAP